MNYKNLKTLDDILQEISFSHFDQCHVYCVSLRMWSLQHPVPAGRHLLVPSLADRSPCTCSQTSGRSRPPK